MVKNFKEFHFSNLENGRRVLFSSPSFAFVHFLLRSYSVLKLKFELWCHAFNKRDLSTFLFGIVFGVGRIFSTWPTSTDRRANRPDLGRLFDRNRLFSVKLLLRNNWHTSIRWYINYLLTWGASVTLCLLTQWLKYNIKWESQIQSGS